MKEIIMIEVHKTNSNKFEKAINIMKSFPHYEIKILNEKEVHRCYIKTDIEYINNYTKIEPLVLLVRNWKNAKVFLHNQLMGKLLIYFREFQNEMDFKIKSLINYEYKAYGPENIAINNLSLDEGLKPRIVYYPPIYKPFFAFGNALSEKPFFCSCQKTAITNFVKITETLNNKEIKEKIMKFFPTKVVQWCENTTEDLLKTFEYEKEICHKCVDLVPKYKYSHPMYESKFMQHFGWFVQMKYLEYGISKELGTLSVIKDQCPPYLYEKIMRKEDIDEEIENIVRTELDYPRKGERWISETIMFNILESMFSDLTVYRHHRPKWLEGLELDAYIPEKKLAFEYNGKQHYEPVEFFGGEERLLIQKENDIKKSIICQKKGIDLIIIKYDEDLSRDLIQSKIDTI